jgi:hypothetical protein
VLGFVLRELREQLLNPVVLLDDDLLELRSPTAAVGGRDASAVRVVAGPQLATRFDISQNRWSARDDGTTW